MPIPIIIWGVGLGVSALYGAYKGTSGVMDLNEAKRIGESAQKRHKNAVLSLEQKRKETTQRAEKYGGYIRDVNESTIKEFKQFLKSLQKKTNISKIDIPKSVNVSAINLKEYQQKILEPQSDLFTAIGAIGAGSAASGSALGLVGLFGTASTGTGIAALSGIAAQNATLAWIGGGTLAAGGAGVTGGTIVLGGLAVAPALLIGGFFIASKGEKALTEARSFEAKAEKSIKQIDILKEFLDKIQVRINELDNVLKKLNRRARISLKKLDSDNFSNKSKSDMLNLTLTLNMITALLDVMRTPILDADGDLTIASEKIQMKYEEYLEGNNE